MTVKSENGKWKEGYSCFPGMWEGPMLWKLPLTPRTCLGMSVNVRVSMEGT